MLATTDRRPYHRVAGIFPLMQGTEFDELVADIKENGLRDTIWLHPNDSIIDGRNRYRPCLKAGVEPQFRTWDGNGDLLAFVVSTNLHRRHLNTSQKAVVALAVLEY
jgi:ParB-like chromosome segregation protein Spo0J